MKVPLVVYTAAMLVFGIAIGAALMGFGTKLRSHNAAQGDPKGKNPVQVSRALVTAQAHQSEVTFTYHITPANHSADAGLQIYILRSDLPKGSPWQGVTATGAQGGPLVLSLYRDLDNTGTFTANLPKGTYTEYRLLLFNSPDGKSIDFGHVLYDTANDPERGHQNLHLTVETSAAPVNSPVLDYPPNPKEEADGAGAYTVTIPAMVKVPQGYTVQDDGLWVMAKGDAGFSQVWAPLKSAQPSGKPDNPYEFIPIDLTLKSVKPGLWNEQFGIFTNSWGNPLEWVYPGLYFEVGGDSWEKKAPEGRIPPRLRVHGGRFQTASGQPYQFYAGNPAGLSAVHFVRGGNYGNALLWTLSPQLNTPGYFTLLGDMGCHFVRTLFNPDRYLNEPVYQHAVDQVVQNIWAAGLYPLIGPQDLPQGDTLDQRAAQGQKVVEILARKYKGRSIWIEVCNEPHEYTTWAQWKPVAERYAKAVRAIDPDAFVIVPFENYSHDGRAAAKDPITSVPVDLYDGHAYVDPSQIATLFGPPAHAGLPVLIGEYGGGADYLRRMDIALEHGGNFMAIAPWAFTVKGQDSMPLVDQGDTAVLSYTPAGQVIADDYSRWDRGSGVQ